MKIATDDLKVPTAAQIAKRVDQLVAAEKQKELDQLRRRFEQQALIELADELNHDHLEGVLTDQLRAAGMTFVQDVWPDHPAAGHLVGETIGRKAYRRPCGVRRPFRLAADGVWFGDYWVVSPVFPAGRLPQGGLVLAFLVDGTWRQAVAEPPPVNSIYGGITTGFDSLRGLGLRMNPEPLRGRPEHDDDANVDALHIGDRAMADGTVRYAADLLWRYVNATQNEAPWEVPAA